MSETQQNKTWQADYGDIIAEIIKYGNLYANINKKASDFGTNYQVSLSDIQILEKVYLNEKKQMKMNELAAELGMTQSAFSKNINKLVKMGLVKKYHLENNKKDVFLLVTEEGKETYELQLQFVYERIFSRVVTVLQKMEKNDIRGFIQVLEIMGEFSKLFKSEEKEEIKFIPIIEE